MLPHIEPNILSCMAPELNGCARVALGGALGSLRQRLIDTVTRQPPGRIGKPLRMCSQKCLTSFFELSVHPFGTILKSDTLTFQSASIQPSPVKDGVGRMEKTLF